MGILMVVMTGATFCRRFTTEYPDEHRSIRKVGYTYSLQIEEPATEAEKGRIYEYYEP